MPLHDYSCPTCQKVERRFCKMADLKLPQICSCGKLMVRRILAPMVQGEIAPYKSPIDGNVIHSKRQRREDLLRHNCVEYEPGLKEEQIRRTAKAEEKLEKEVEATLDQCITEMPARKKELLAQEIRSGADTNFSRATAQ